MSANYKFSNSLRCLEYLQKALATEFPFLARWTERTHQLLQHVLAMLNKEVLESDWLQAVDLMYSLNSMMRRSQSAGAGAPEAALLPTTCSQYAAAAEAAAGAAQPRTDTYRYRYSISLLSRCKSTNTDGETLFCYHY
jgi:hypothetical protein